MKNSLLILAISLSLYAHGQETALQEIADKTLDNKLVFGLSLAVKQHATYFEVSAGTINRGERYFIASTTKIYVTALILKFESEGKLSLDEPISKFLPADLCQNLNHDKSTDFSSQITIRHLLSHTSGIPDYFGDKMDDGSSLYHELTSGRDTAWTANDAVNASKRMKSRFKPGEKDYAHYSDTNFQLLDLILEKISGKSIFQLMQDEIFDRLNMHATELFQHPRSSYPEPLYYKSDSLLLPEAMSSFRGDGGIVSTASESILFLENFFNGTFFPKETLTELYDWKKVMFPLEYGVGIMRFKLPKYMTGGKEYPELIGHSGLSGAFSFYCPELDLYLAGTVNQIHQPSLSYKMLIQVLDVFTEK